MNPERWARVKAIVAEALNQKLSERDRFAAEACGSDAGLLGEVRRLLEQETLPGAGQMVGHYRIDSKIGEGGMGVVYKAEDTKLHRTVALKFLRNDAVERPDLKARFLTEAEAVAALDHPNVCTIYEIGETEGQPFLAMAYVEGESLAEKIRKRPLPLNEAVDIAIQMAEGLAAAHKKAIVHRDIKSGNAMVNPEGRVKIMDFGLAQLVDSTRITQTGMIMGTPAYMSPEQIRGEPVDRRTDIWSFGVVIYEMVSGQLPFRGDAPQSVALDIQSGEPELLTSLRADVPLELELIVGKALEKRREERYQHVEEMVVDLKSLGRKLAAGKSTVVSGGLRGPRRRRWKQVVLLLAAVIAAAGLSVLGTLFLRPAPEHSAPLRKFTLHPREGTTSAQISPDGKHIAYTTGRGGDAKLWIHDLDQLAPRRIDGAGGAARPFWSPDSLLVGFAAAGELRKVSVSGGAVTTISGLPGDGEFVGGTWSPDGTTIAFSRIPHIYEVPARGGNPRVIIEAGGEILHFEEPEYVPAGGGYRLLLTWQEKKNTRHNSGSRSPETGELRPLCPINCFDPFYSPSGHVLTVGPLGDVWALWAVPFSMETMKARGERFPIAFGCAVPSVSLDGTLACLEDPEYMRPPSRLVWWDRTGHQLSSVGEPVPYFGGFRLSPNGEQVALYDYSMRGILVYDLRKNTGNRQALPLERSTGPFAWSPSGAAVAFRGQNKDGWDIFVLEIGGRGDVAPLHSRPLDGFPWDWSPDGSTLVYGVGGSYDDDLWCLKVNGSGKSTAVPFLQTPARESHARLSPDGLFVAYQSDQSGRTEVYIQHFPGGGGTRQISLNGGRWPRWRRDGRELFYVEGETLVAVAVTPGRDFTAGTPERLFRHPDPESFGGGYDASPDGQRFLLAVPADASPAAIRVVQNWFAEFKDQQSRLESR